MRMPLVRVALGGAVRRENDFVSAHGLGEIGERHFVPGIQGGKECLKLCLIRVIRNIA